MFILACFYFIPHSLSLHSIYKIYEFLLMGLCSDLLISVVTDPSIYHVSQCWPSLNPERIYLAGQCSGNALHFYSGGTQFESVLGNHLFSLRDFVILIFFRQMQEYYVERDYHRFIRIPFRSSVMVIFHPTRFLIC